MGRWTYKADYAQGYADDRRKKVPKHVKFTDEVKAFVVENIQEDWSPEQISGYAKRQGLFSISHEQIYQFMLQDKKLGDWEVNTIIGKSRKQAIVSIVERKSKFTILRKVQRKTSESVSQAIINGLRLLADKVLTITNDNGSEFEKHEMIAGRLKADFCFAHPYSPWERGLN